MRHGDKQNNLGRTASHRKAMLSNMTCSLIAHKRIITTLAKAKALRVFAEPIITRSKVDTMHNRRHVFACLQDKEAINELFGTIGDKVANRPGGYTRIIKMPRRLGDASDMALIELVDFNELYNANDKAAGQKKTRRSRRGTGAAAATATVAGGATAIDTDARATAEATAAAHEAAEADIAAETTETVIPSTDDSGKATPEAPAQEEGGEGAGA